MTTSTVWKAATGALIALTLAPIRVEATITSVTENAARDDDNARGYTYAEITVHGTVDRADGSVGVYAVPAVLIYPRHRRANRVGVVDWVNSAYYHFLPATTEFATFQFTLLATENYLFDEGYTYVSIQWDKAVTEIFGPAAPIDDQALNHLVYGSIDRSADAWEILLDAARLLKDPSAYPGNDGPQPVATVLSSGYSQGAGAQLELLAEELDPHLIYDGHLIQMIGLACFKREDVAPHFGFFGDCSPLPTNGQHAPVIVLASETDMLIFNPTVLGLLAPVGIGRIAGTFTRFSDDELLDRYRSRDEYVRLVRRATDHLATSAYITDRDRMALIAAAECQPLPEGLQCPK